MRIAVLGLGSIGRRHAKNFRSLGCDVRPIDLHDPLDLDGCDAAVIATPPVSHVELAWKALGAGCHLMIEKPVSVNLTDLGHLFAACQTAGKVHMVAYPWRYDRSMNEAKAKVADLGGITAWSAWYAYDTGNATALSMGPLLDCSHAIDFLRWMLGEPRAVAARLAGRTATLEAYFGDAPGEAILSLDRPLHCEWSIKGTEGTVQWLRSRDVDYDLNDMYVTEAKHFLACIRGEATPLTDGWDGRETLRVALAAKRSAEEGGRWIAR